MSWTESSYCLLLLLLLPVLLLQELRELAVRGLDGPGLHVLDLVPEAFSHVAGVQAEVEARTIRYGGRPGRDYPDLT